MKVKTAIKAAITICKPNPTGLCPPPVGILPGH
jgi:hypothetical protein